MIRKSALVVVFLLLALCLVLALLFRNGVLESVAEEVLSEGFGSRVEIDGMYLNPFTLEAGYARLQVADAVDPWLNRIEMGQTRFDVDGMGLLSRRMIIDEMSIRDVALDSRRQAPAKRLSKRSPGDAGQDAETGWNKLTANLPAFDLGSLSDSIDITALMGGRELLAVERLEQAQDEARDLLKGWQGRLEEEDLEVRANDLQQRYRTLRQQEKPRSLKALKAYRDELKTIQRDFAQLRRDVSTRLDLAKSDLAKVRSWAPDLRQEIGADVVAIKRLAKIGGLEVSEIAEILFGGVAVQYLQQAMRYLDLMRDLVGDENEAPPPKRRSGRDIHFATTGTLPNLIIRKALFEREQQDSDWGYTIKALDISSDARRYGQPTQLKALLNHPSKGEWRLDGVLDHRNDRARDQFDVSAKNLRLEAIALGEREGLPTAMAAKEAHLTGRLGLIGEQIQAEVNLVSEQVEFVFRSSDQGALSQKVEAIFADIPALELDIALTGTQGEMSLEASSNLDNIISRRIKRLVDTRVQKVEAEVRDAVTAKLAQRRNQLDQELAAPRDALQAGVNRYRSRLEEAMGAVEAAKQAAEKRIKGRLEGLLK